MARTLSARPMCSPAAMSSTPLPRFGAFTTALPGLQGPSGIPEVPISGLPSPPSSPPLAAITSSNELALTPKPNKQRQPSSSSSAARARRGGATLRIREECERFFCETMMAVFYGERNGHTAVSGLTGVYQHRYHQTNSSNSHPPQHDSGFEAGSSSLYSVDSGYFGSFSGSNNSNNSHAVDYRRSSTHQLTPPHDGPDEMCVDSRVVNGAVEATQWMEIWDYQGANSFRAFVAEDFALHEKALFVFFDAGVVGRDLKKSLVALIELAEGPLACAQLVVCVDRSIEADDAKTLTKGLRWAGFDLTTLDHWAGAIDVTSREWVFMGMEI